MTLMKISYVMGIVQPVSLQIGDEELGETQILMISIILIQLQKLLLISCQTMANYD